MGRLQGHSANILQLLVLGVNPEPYTLYLVAPNLSCHALRSVERLQGHSASILQLLVLGERLLSLGADRRLLVWAVGEFGAPQVPRLRQPP